MFCVCSMPVSLFVPICACRCGVGFLQVNGERGKFRVRGKKGLLTCVFVPARAKRPSKEGVKQWQAKSHRETGTDDAGLASFLPFTHLPVGGRWEEDERGKCLALVVDVCERILLFFRQVYKVSGIERAKTRCTRGKSL